MRFVAALTTDAACIRRLTVACRELPHNPLARVLISPVFARPSAIEAVRAVRAELKSVVYFDSGGYYVQQGRIRYEELSSRLLELYEVHQWADHYVLPDFVPRSADSDRTVTSKVKATVREAKLFVRRLPRKLRGKVIPVIHGRSRGDIDRCLEAYMDLGVSTMGFGSLATGGSGGGSNLMTNGASRLIRYVSETLRGTSIQLHLFGVGAPGVVGLLSGLGVTSFDSATWMKAAGFGQVFFPFSRSFSFRYRKGQPFRKGLTRTRLQAVKRLTTHVCAFCVDFERLRGDRLGRMIHNLLSIVDGAEMAGSMSEASIQRMYARVSPYYQKRHRALTEERENGGVVNGS